MMTALTSTAAFGPALAVARSKPSEVQPRGPCSGRGSRPRRHDGAHLHQTIRRRIPNYLGVSQPQGAVAAEQPRSVIDQCAV